MNRRTSKHKLELLIKSFLRTYLSFKINFKKDVINLKILMFC